MADYPPADAGSGDHDKNLNGQTSVYGMHPAPGGNQDWCLHAERLPGRLNAEQAAKLIGCQSHDISLLIRKKLLRALGDGPPNCVKYFSSSRILESCADDKWLDRVTRTITEARRKLEKTSDKQVVNNGQATRAA